MTTLDELVVAAVERGLSDEDLARLLLGYRDGESAAQTLSRMFPLNGRRTLIRHEQLAILVEQ